jgi:hypothetical protein
MGDMTSSINAPAPEVFRPHGSRILAAVLVVAALTGVVAVLATGGPRAWPSTLPLLLVGYVAWLLFWYPKVVVEAAGVRLVNPLRTLLVPWNAVIDVDTKYSMTLVTPTRRYSAWAAPAPGVVASLRDSRQSQREERRDGTGSVYKSIRPGDRPGTDSGNVAAVVRRRLDRMADAGLIDVDVTQTAKPSVAFHVPHALVLLLLLVLAFVLPSVVG